MKRRSPEEMETRYKEMGYEKKDGEWAKKSKKKKKKKEKKEKEEE